MEVSQVLWALLIALLIYLYFRMRRVYSTFQRQGIAHRKPLPLVGNLFKLLTFRCSIGDIYTELYKAFPNEKIVGIYELMKPVLVIRDLKILEKILIKDFSYFTDHPEVSDKKSILAYGLFQMNGIPWHSMRAKISPAFTSGKLKMMFPEMLKCSDKLVDAVGQNKSKDYDLRPDFVDYTMDVMASSVFAIQIKDKEVRSEFVRLTTQLFQITPLKFVKLIIMIQLPKLGQLLGVSLISNEANNYFKGIISTTLEQRSRGNYQRNDYVQQLLKLKEKGSIDVQANEEEDAYLNLNGEAPPGNLEITDDLLAGQAFQFISAGLHPLQQTMTIVMYDLALYPQIQERVRIQIKEVLQKHGEYSYESVKEMTYLEQCIQETFRIHPLLPILFRVCTKDYVMEDGLHIKRGQKIIIPVDALHMDPKHYPDPEVYNPDRLPPNSIRNNLIYMPFGDGPRICVGLRFAMINMKLGLARIIEKNKFTLSSKTQVPFKISKQSFLLYPTSKILFNICPA